MGQVGDEGSVDPRLLRPDPGESRGEFEARVLAAVLGLEGPVPSGERPVPSGEGTAHAEDGDADGGDVADGGTLGAG